MIQIVIKKPGQPAEICSIDPKLAVYQKIVGGPIEFVPLTENLAFYANEVGLLEGLDSNICCNGQVIVGSIMVFVCGEEGDEVSLNDEQAAFWARSLNEMAVEIN